jgi:hypothetical protein
MKTRTLVTLAVGIIAFSLLGTMAVLAEGPTTTSPHLAGKVVGSVAQSEALDWVGQIGGPVSSVTLHGGDVYLGVGRRMVIVDITDPTQPEFVGQTALQAEAVEAIAVGGDYAYLTIGVEGIIVVDVSDLSNPTTVGGYDTPGMAHSVAVTGTLAYVADGSQGVRVVDVSNPANPKEAGFYNTSGEAVGVIVVGQYVYVADGSQGLQALDIVNPSSPAEAGAYDTPGEALDVVVVGDYAYIADYDQGLRIVDIANTSYFTETGYYHPASFDAYDLQVVGDYAYIAAGTDGLHIVDISDPTDPVWFDDYEIPIWAYGVDVVGDYAYLALGEEGLRVVEVSDSVSSPVAVGAYTMLGYAEKVAVAGDYVYAAEFRGRLHVVGVTDPANMTWHGFSDVMSDADALATFGHYAYVVDEDKGLRVFDLSDPRAPAEVGLYANASCAAGVVVAGNYVHIYCDTSPRWGIVDVSNPAAPTEVYWKEFSYQIASVADVAVEGDLAYLALIANTALNDLYIYDISNPGAPNLVGDYAGSSNRYNEVEVSGNYAYLATGDRVDVVDVSDPTNPTEVGSYEYAVPSLSIFDLVVSGDYAYVLYGYQGPTPDLVGSLRVLDISDPANLVEVAAHDTFGYAKDMAVSGDTIFVADSDAGLTAFQFYQDEATALITALAGGHLSSTSGDTHVSFGAGAFTDTVQLTYRQLSDAGDTGNLVGIGQTFDLTAVYTNTGAQAMLAPGASYTTMITYTTTGMAVEATLGLYGWDATHRQWSQQGITSSVNVTGNVVSAQVDHLSRFAVLGEARRVYLPLVLKP